MEKIPRSGFITKYYMAEAASLGNSEIPIIDSSNSILAEKCALVSEAGVSLGEASREFVDLFADYVATTIHGISNGISRSLPLFSLEPGSSPCVYQRYLGWSTFSEFLQTCSIKTPEQVKRQNEAEGKLDLELMSWEIKGDNVRKVIEYFFHSLEHFCNSRSFYADLRPNNVLLDIIDGDVSIEFIDCALERFQLNEAALNRPEPSSECLHPLSYVYEDKYWVSNDCNSIVLFKDEHPFKKLSYQYNKDKGSFVTEIVQANVQEKLSGGSFFQGEKGSVTATIDGKDYKKRHLIYAALKNSANDFLRISKFNRKNNQNGGVLFNERKLSEFISTVATPSVGSLAEVIKSDITICNKATLSGSADTTFGKPSRSELTPSPPDEAGSGFTNPPTAY